MESSALKFFFFLLVWVSWLEKKNQCFSLPSLTPMQNFLFTHFVLITQRSCFSKKKKKKKKKKTIQILLVSYALQKVVRTQISLSLIVIATSSAKIHFFFSISWCYIQLQESSSCLYAKPLGPKSQNSIRNCL